jgi:hypothetical protein
MCLVFFLIPVTRHNVLLAAMGWSPIHALRIHIWFGYLAFVFMLIHGVMLVPVWFLCTFQRRTDLASNSVLSDQCVVSLVILAFLLLPLRVLWTDYDYPVWQQIVPNRQCWTWT